MCAAPSTRRAAAEIEGQAAQYRINNRSIHQFWHLFAAQFRHVFLAPQRRPDSGRVAWTWREDAESRPVTATELAEVRRRLSEAARSLNRGFGDLDAGDVSASSSESLDAQVRAAVSEMVAQLMAQRDAALAAFVCRTDAGLMLHSWGASTAAKPFFPDSQNGEVSGSVIVGSEHLSGVAIVLENAQGSVLMRMHSEHDGMFRFLHVAPGHYRIRAPDRSEFPAEGIPVTMERESVTGLELRGSGIPSSEKPNPVAASFLGVTPWYRRKWTGAAALLIFLGIGGCIWNSSQKSSDSTHPKSGDSGWQSASGQLPGNGGKGGDRDDRKVGGDGAFSSLSDSLPPPKTIKPTRGPNDFSDNSKSGAAPLPVAANPDGERVSTDESQKNPPNDANGRPGNGAARPAKSGSKAQPVSSNSAEGKSIPTDPEDNESSDSGASSPLAKSADHSARTPEKSPLNQLSLHSTDEKKIRPPESTVDAAQELQPDPRPQHSGSSPNNAAIKSRNGKNSVSAPGKSGPSSDSNEAMGKSQSEGDAANDDPASGGFKQTKPNQKTASASQQAPGHGATGAAAGSEAPANDGTTVEPNAAPRGSEESKSPPNKTEKKTAKPAADDPMKPDESKTPESGPDNRGPANDDGRKAVASGGAAAKKNPVSAAAPAGTTAAVDDAKNDQSSENNSGDGKSPQAKPAEKSEKKSAAASPAASPADLESERPTKEPVTTSPAIVAAAKMKADDVVLTLYGKIRGSSWKPRLVRDRIIPTRPLTVREEEQMEALRKKVGQERAAQMPAGFKSPHVSSGIILALVGESFPTAEPLHWTDESGHPVTDASAQSGVAELAWPASGAPVGSGYVLSSSTGKTLARVTIAGGGFLILETIPEVRMHYWLGIEADGSPDASLRGFEWRQSTGEAIPASWRSDDGWRGGKGRRIEIPLDAASVRVGHYGIFLMDPRSGWALTGDVTLQ